MLVELGVVEQRYRAVLEVLDEGVPVTVVARRYLDPSTRRAYSAVGRSRVRCPRLLVRKPRPTDLSRPLPTA